MGANEQNNISWWINQSGPLLGKKKLWYAPQLILLMNISHKRYPSANKSLNVMCPLSKNVSLYYMYVG
jgi:hypothetical protein